MLQRAYVSLNFRPFNLSGKTIIFQDNKPSSPPYKDFDYLREWYSPLEMKPGANPPGKWFFKLI